jgi:hypothetical protein
MIELFMSRLMDNPLNIGRFSIVFTYPVFASIAVESRSRLDRIEGDACRESLQESLEIPPSVRVIDGSAFAESSDIETF